MPQTKTRQAAKRDVELVRPIEAASGDHNGEPFVLSPREVFNSDHQLVRAYPHLFQPVEQTRDRPDVEQMTAGPGEKRGSSSEA
jgi:hypothetical protein